MKTHGRALVSAPRLLLRLIRVLLTVSCLLVAFLPRRGGMAVASNTRLLHGRTAYATHTTTPTCVPLQGIESNATGSLDPTAFLDLDLIKVFLALEPFNLQNPVIPTVARCSAGLETPIAMRNLLGEPDKNYSRYIRGVLLVHQCI